MWRYGACGVYGVCGVYLLCAICMWLVYGVSSAFWCVRSVYGLCGVCGAWWVHGVYDDVCGVRAVCVEGGGCVACVWCVVCACCV